MDLGFELSSLPLQVSVYPAILSSFLHSTVRLPLNFPTALACTGKFLSDEVCW